MVVHYSVEEIIDQVGPRFFERGVGYYHGGRVLELDVGVEGDTVRGLTRGSGGRHYVQDIAIFSDIDGAWFEGDCTCPVSYNCKHVAAVLLAALDRQVPDEPEAARIDEGARELDTWLDELRAAACHSRGGQPGLEDVRERLLYILTPQHYPRVTHIGLQLQVARMLQKGGYGKASHFSVSTFRSDPARPARHLMDNDVFILRRLLARQVVDALPPERLHGAESGELLAEILVTGRCHWRDKDTPALVPGAMRPGRLEWAVDETGRQKLVIVAEPPASDILPVAPPYYLDTGSGECGPLALGLPTKLVSAALAAPAVSPGQVADVRRRLAETPLPAPREIEQRQRSGVAPCPILRLSASPSSGDPRPWQTQRLAATPAACLSLDYGGREISPDRPGETVDHYEAGVVEIMPRDPDREWQARERLRALGFVRLAGIEAEAGGDPACWFQGSPASRDLAGFWLDFMFDQAPRLGEEGWRVEVHDQFPLKLATGGDISARVEAQGGNAWFELELGIDVDGERRNLVPIIESILREHGDLLDPRVQNALPETHRVLVALADGRLLPVATKRLLPILQTLTELADPDRSGETGPLTLPVSRIGELAALEQAEPDFRMDWSSAGRLEDLAARLGGFRGIEPVKPPRGLRAGLRPYQQEGLSWLQFLRRFGFNGVLADDMGLGKTVQALAHIRAEKNAGRLRAPVLVVAPTSLMFNWRQEAERFAPSLKVLTLHGPDRRLHFEQLDGHDLVLTTYALLPRDAEALAAQPFHIVILDEAQYIKNPRTRAAKVARGLQAEHRLCLTGTPLENHLGELWSIFDFLMPGLLGDERRFRRLFRTPIEQHGDQERAGHLARRVRPFLLRRTKEAVAAELPPKTETVHSTPLEGAQRDLYETIRVAMQRKVHEVLARKGLEGGRIEILDALLKLRQVCCDPRLVKLDAARRVTRSVKLDMLMALLPELIEEGRRVLLFSQFTSMLGLIQRELDERGIEYLKLTGQTRKRGEMVQAFQAGEVPLFLISLKAGGTGLNLTAADTVIHYDPWWNPAVETQATDRAHRIGQDKPVFVYKLLTDDTVESRIQAMQARKQALADGLFTGSGGRLPDAGDLEALFEPL
jgi:superfamily II DNA or RNA helicase